MEEIHIISHLDDKRQPKNIIIFVFISSVTENNNFLSSFISLKKSLVFFEDFTSFCKVILVMIIKKFIKIIKEKKHFL